MPTDTLSTIAVPLNKLLAGEDNVRTTAAAEGIEELAASIAAVGLLQSLVVRPQPRGKFAVVAGRRRLTALALLAEKGTLQSNWPVPCRVTPTNADLTEIGLTENVMRIPMHPADEFAAFAKMIHDGKCVADVAARFGVAEAVVSRRLALARVSPVLMQQYRAGLLNLETPQAFTLTDDHAKQEEVWTGLQPWNRDARTVRQMLSKDAIPATDPRVRFLGIDNYEAAGGLLRRDLFSSDEEQGTQILDPAKLTRLVGEKLATLASRAQAEGWKWVEVQPTLDHAAIGKLRRIQPQPVPLPAKAEAKLQKLEDKRLALESQLSEENDDANEFIYQQVEEIDEAISKIEQSRKSVYPDDVKATTGMVISIGHNGEVSYVYGLLRREDAKERTRQSQENSRAAEEDDVTGTTEEKEEDSPAAYPAPVIESLTMYKTAAIAAELAQQPGIALAALVHALVVRHFGMDLNLYRTETSVQISLARPSLDGAIDSSAVVQLEQQRQNWLALFPRTAPALWQWCLDQDQETLLRLLAFLTAISVNAVQAVRVASSESDGKNRREHADQLASALHVDMTQWFTPTASNLFGRVSKAQTLAALQDAGKTIPDAAKLKKAELADAAERELRGSGWLPAPVRIAVATEQAKAVTAVHT